MFKSFQKPAIVVAIAAASISGVTLAKIAPTVAAALADPARADQAGDDTRRQAGEVITLSGVKPGWQVADYAPGSGYWTRIFTNVVGPQGHVYALYPAALVKFSADKITALQALNLKNVTVTSEPDDGIDAPAGTLDLVWTVQNYHDIPQSEIKDVNASVFKALKKGGIFMVIDHADADFRGSADTTTLHRIDPIFVKNQVMGAGFEFVSESNVLRNKADDHKLKVFDPAIRGHTDQFVYKFRKP
jgi:predicted methyltransferase